MNSESSNSTNFWLDGLDRVAAINASTATCSRVGGSGGSYPSKADFGLTSVDDGIWTEILAPFGLSKANGADSANSSSGSDDDDDDTRDSLGPVEPRGSGDELAETSTSLAAGIAGPSSGRCSSVSISISKLI